MDEEDDDDGDEVDGDEVDGDVLQCRARRRGTFRGAYPQRFIIGRWVVGAMSRRWTGRIVERAGEAL